MTATKLVRDEPRSGRAQQARQAAEQWREVMNMSMETILIVLVVVLLLGGGGWGYSRWR
jgi:hypothetical protein